MQGCVEWICVCVWVREGGREGGREMERGTMKRGMWNFRIRVRKGGDNEKEQRESGTGVREKGRELRGWMWAKPYVVISYLEAPSRARAIAHRCRKVARASTFWFFFHEFRLNFFWKDRSRRRRRSTPSCSKVELIEFRLFWQSCHHPVTSLEY